MTIQAAGARRASAGKKTPGLAASAESSARACVPVLMADVDGSPAPASAQTLAPMATALKWQANTYLTQNPDLARLADGGQATLFEHFLTNGVWEKRRFSTAARFSRRHVLEQSIAYGEHVIVFGWSERPMPAGTLPVVVLDGRMSTARLVRGEALTYWRNDVSQALGTAVRARRHGFMLIAKVPAWSQRHARLVLTHGQELIAGDVTPTRLTVDEFVQQPLRLLQDQLTYEEMVLVFRDHRGFLDELTSARAAALRYSPAEQCFASGAPKRPIDLSICAVVFGKAELLKPFMVSLLDKRPAGSCWELLLLVNARLDLDRVVRAAQWCHATYGMDVKVVSTRDNWGFGLGLNELTSRARGAVSMLTNVDIGFRTLDFDILREELVGKKTLLAAYQYNPGGSLQHEALRHEKHTAIVNGSALEYLQTRLVGRNTLSPRPGRREVQYFGAACMAGDTSHLRSLGPFDADYLYAYHEDCDLSWRARRQGFSCIVSPALEVIHYESSGSAAAHMPLRAVNAANLTRFMKACPLQPEPQSR